MSDAQGMPSVITRATCSTFLPYSFANPLKEPVHFRSETVNCFVDFRARRLQLLLQ